MSEAIPVQKIIEARTISSTHPLWDTFECDLVCGHRRRKRVHIDQNFPQEVRCPDCRDKKPRVFDPTKPSMKQIFDNIPNEGL